MGFFEESAFVHGDAAIAVDALQNDWASIAICALDAMPIEESQKVLIVVCGRVENSNMGWDENRTTVGRNWGEGPTVAEAVTARITLPGKMSVFALDGTGAKTTDVETENADGKTVFETSPKYKTIWYGATR